MIGGAPLRFEAEIVRAVALPYLEYRPAAPPPSRGWPLVLYLHGAGEKGTDGESVRRAALPALLEAGLTIDAIVLCPQCPSGPGWPIADLAALLDWARGRAEIDADAAHVTGESMGGRGAWELAYWRHADLASIVTVAGFGIPNLAPLLARLPARLFHGTADDVLPLARSAEMATALAQASYHPLEGAPHDCAARVYQDPDLWRWILSHRRVQESEA